MTDFDTQKPHEPNEPNGLGSRSLTNRVRNSLIATRLRTQLIGGGILLFAMVAGTVLAGRYYSGINGKITFDLAGEALPVLQDPKGNGIAEQDIWTVNPDGSHLVQLTANSRDWDQSPEWSPDSKRIAYVNTDPVADQPNLDGRIYVMNPDGSGRIEISPPKGEDVDDPSWSPDGQRIVFSSTVSCGIFLANADGSGTPKKLPTPGFSGCAAGSEWSPDGTQIAFDGYHGSSFADIYVMDVSPQGDTSGLRRLTDWRYTDEDAAWSPDGTEIAFTSNRAYLHNSPDPDFDRWQSEIYKIDVGSLKVTRLTHSPLEDTAPTWSPDSEQIAYVKQKLARGTHSSIYKMDSDGSNSTPVFEKDRAYAFNPDWAP
jgi:Tol biopolymer transport system component